MKVCSEGNEGRVGEQKGRADEKGRGEEIKVSGEEEERGKKVGEKCIVCIVSKDVVQLCNKNAC